MIVKSVRASFGLLKRLCALYVWYNFCANVSWVDLGNMLQEIWICLNLDIFFLKTCFTKILFKSIHRFLWKKLHTRLHQEEQLFLQVSTHVKNLSSRRRSHISNDHKWVTDYLFDKIQNILIIDKLNIAPVDFFLCVLFLLHLKHMLFKKMQFFLWCICTSTV